MISNNLFSFIENAGYYDILIYIIIGYLLYYFFSISIVSIACLIIGAISGSYVTYKFISLKI